MRIFFKCKFHAPVIPLVLSPTSKYFIPDLYFEKSKHMIFFFESVSFEKKNLLKIYILFT